MIKTPYIYHNDDHKKICPSTSGWEDYYITNYDDDGRKIPSCSCVGDQNKIHLKDVDRIRMVATALNYILGFKSFIKQF